MERQQKLRKEFERLSFWYEIKDKIKRVFNPKQVKDCDWKILEAEFIKEWQKPDLDLHKYGAELTYLLAGYFPGYYGRESRIAELKGYSKSTVNGFLPFLVIKNSNWDGLPLVNASARSTELFERWDCGFLPCFLPEEVKIILDGLMELTVEGFQERYKRESQKEKSCPWIYCEDPDYLLYLTDYYNEIVDYYKDAALNNKAILFYWT